MTTEEIYTAISKSNQEKAYRIVYDINNNMIEEAVDKIQSIYSCDRDTALEVSYMFKRRLWKSDLT